MLTTGCRRSGGTGGGGGAAGMARLYLLGEPRHLHYQRLNRSTSGGEIFFLPFHPSRAVSEIILELGCACCLHDGQIVLLRAVNRGDNSKLNWFFIEQKEEPDSNSVEKTTGIISVLRRQISRSLSASVGKTQERIRLQCRLAWATQDARSDE